MTDKLIPNWFRGDTLHIEVETTFDDEPEDLTGATLSFVVKAVDTDTDANAKLRVNYTVPAGADATAGRASMTIPASGSVTTPPSNTGALPPGKYIVGLVRTLAGSPPDVWTIVKQKVTVLQRMIGE